MTRLKNLTRSVLLVPDAKLRLAPGEAADVPELTPQCLAALRNGVATKLEPPEEDEEEAAFVREELLASTATPAAEPPPRATRKREAKEPAEGVDALKARLAEVSGGGP